MITVTVALGLTLFVGLVGLAVDLGFLYLAAQRCQNIADAAALGGAQELPYADLASARADAYADANAGTTEPESYIVSTTCYARGDAMPVLGTAPHGGAIRVTVSKTVSYRFLRLLGSQGVTVSRTGMSTKVLAGVCLAPLWITESTPVAYGAPVNLLMADAPHTGIPGNFGFLAPAGGVDFDACLKGILTPEQAELQRVQVDDYVWAHTGLAVGQFRGDLKTDTDARLARAQQPPYSGDTFEDYHTDNPRIMLVPFVRYIDGTGSGARFQIIRFGAFWLEDVITTGNDRQIVGRFIDFTTPGGTGYSIKATHLMG